MTLHNFLTRIPGALEIPTFNEMKARTALLRNCARTQVRQVGEDRFGEPIEMISIGEGAKSILVVGAPHPNEPIGCVAIEWLIEQLRQDEGFNPGLSWHFIKAIEPYALMQNEGWFKRPDPSIYLDHFYRPAFRHQAEYAFPSNPARTADCQTTPENAAYRRAIKLACPDLLASLHGADCAGAFYFLSHQNEALAQALSSQPGKRGLTLNSIGEGVFGSDDVVLAPAVFLSARTSLGLEQAYAAGASIDEFLARTSPSTVTLVPEVPLFTDIQLEGQPVPYFGNCIPTAWDEQVVEVLEPFVERLAEGATALETLYLDAIRENVDWAKEIPTNSDARKQVNAAEHASHLQLSRLVGLRPVAMAKRLAAMRGGRAESPAMRTLTNEMRAATSQYLHSALADPLMHKRLAPTPLHLTVANQIEAILTTARFGLGG